MPPAGGEARKASGCLQRELADSARALLQPSGWETSPFPSLWEGGGKCPGKRQLVSRG